jgi:hypothetical protein
MTEVGPVTFECPSMPGRLHVIEESYLPEIIDPANGQAVAPGTTGELVLTTLGRVGSPVLRYRTGDLVKASAQPVCACGRSALALEGGILSRVDDMIVVRGVNIYPSAVDEIIRQAGRVAEYRVHVDTSRALAELRIEVETGAPNSADLKDFLEKELNRAFSMRIPVECVSPGTLPRFELKARRWVRSAGPYIKRPGAFSRAPYCPCSREGRRPMALRHGLDAQTVTSLCPWWSGYWCPPSHQRQPFGYRCRMYSAVPRTNDQSLSVSARCY